jgi:hypothetical protein
MAGGKYCRRCECYLVTIDMFCKCCGMQLRTTPAERECKEKVNSKKKGGKKEIRITDCIEVSSASWLNTIFSSYSSK